MQLAVDLHSHSGHAGGVGNLSPAAVASTMRWKGIAVFGTGDCLQPDWLVALSTMLREAEPGFFRLAQAGDDAGRMARFVLQSEIILTAPVPSGGRKATHVVLVFPGFAAVRDAARQLVARRARLAIGRPFVCCADAADVATLLDHLQSIDDSLLIMPAHVLTPQGVFGADHPVDRLADVFGQFTPRLRCIETGLSADPALLAMIPELDGLTLLSNSDCHSAALNRVGREFTLLDVADRDYPSMIAAIHARRVVCTAEFAPAEGRYYLSGHRGNRVGHRGQECRFQPGGLPPGGRCPICGGRVTVGVVDRACHLAAVQGAADRRLESVVPRQKAIHVVPLVEVIAAGLGLAAVGSARVKTLFDRVLEVFPSEVALWTADASQIESRLASRVPEPVLAAMLAIRHGNFTFDPPGYDGLYGRLAIGQ